LTDTLYIHICVKHFGMTNIKSNRNWQYSEYVYIRVHERAVPQYGITDAKFTFQNRVYLTTWG